MVKVLSLIAVTVLVVLSGCSSINKTEEVGFYSPDHVIEINSPEPRVGLALGGGGVRGFVHLGVLKAFEENDVQMDVVTGTSAGSIVAAFYANQIPVDTMASVASDLSAWTMRIFVSVTMALSRAML